MFKIKTPLYIDGFDSSDYMISCNYSAIGACQVIKPQIGLEWR